MADSTVLDASKMKVVDLRKELKTRGLSYTGDKAELVSRLQTAMAQDDHQDINLDSDEIDSDSVLEEDEKLEDDDDEKSQTDMLDDTAVDTINEELALDDQPVPKPASEVKPMRTLKRKITADTKESKEIGTKKIVLNRAITVTPVDPAVKPDGEPTESKPEVNTAPTDSKIKINADIDAKTRLEMRAKRFGLPVKVSDDERKEARKHRFGQAASANVTSDKTPASLSENLDKLKQRAERFGQSVSKIMTEIEIKERIEKRKAKFGGTVK